MIRRMWNVYRRWLDCRLLWPICKEAAHGNFDHAMGAFITHTLLDPAWEDLTDEQANAIFARLK